MSKQSRGKVGIDRRRILKGIGASAVTTPLLASGSAVAQSDTLEISVFITYDTYQNQGTAPRDVIADYVDQAIDSSYYSGSYTVRTPEVYFDPPSGEDHSGSYRQEYKDFLCCGEHVAMGDGSDGSHQAKDANIMLTNASGPNAGKETGYRFTSTWVGSHLNDLAGDSSEPELYKPVIDESEYGGDEYQKEPAHRLWVVLHELGHLLNRNDNCTSAPNSHQVGRRQTDDNGTLWRTMMAYRISFDDGTNHCGEQQEPLDDDRGWFKYTFSRCLVEYIDPRPADHVCSPSCSDGSSRESLCSDSCQPSSCDDGDDGDGDDDLICVLGICV